MIPEARLQEIEEAAPSLVALQLVAEVRRLRKALERIAGPAQREARSAIARAALTEESEVGHE